MTRSFGGDPSPRPPSPPRSPRAGFARWRVPLGFVTGGLVLWLARPSPRSLAIGLPIALAGQLLRIWAAGHLEKSREITTSGPYRVARHPLYLGSSLMGAGLAVASRDWLVAALIATYLAVTLWTAIRTEEAFLRATFGDGYDRYAQGDLSKDAPRVARRFSLARVWRNKEYRAPLGLLALSAFLLWRALAT